MDCNNTNNREPPINDDEMNEREVADEIDTMTEGELEEIFLENSSDMNHLLSAETMDMPSPEMWPEKVSGIREFINSHASFQESSNDCEVYSKIFTNEDYDYLIEVTRLDVHDLVKKIKELHDQAYELGLEEIREITRGNNLNLFEKRNK